MSRTPTPAQYLLRIDDLCPTVYKRGWARLAEMIREFGIRPILAVVPDNQDPELVRSEPDPEFWNQMRELEAAGAVVGLHGCTHLCVETGRSLLRLHRHTEFAGLPLEAQKERIRDGLAILRGHELHPRLWVAPRHGFDRNTLAALREEGINYLSDGMGRLPFVREGVTWIPQQLWAPAPQRDGLWTICLHPNSLDQEMAQMLREFFERNAASFTSFDRVLTEFPPVQRGLAETLIADAAIARHRLRRARKQLFAR